MPNYTIGAQTYTSFALGDFITARVTKTLNGPSTANLEFDRKFDGEAIAGLNSNVVVTYNLSTLFNGKLSEIGRSMSFGDERMTVSAVGASLEELYSNPEGTDDTLPTLGEEDTTPNIYGDRGLVIWCEDANSSSGTVLAVRDNVLANNAFNGDFGGTIYGTLYLGDSYYGTLPSYSSLVNDIRKSRYTIDLSYYASNADMSYTGDQNWSAGVILNGIVYVDGDVTLGGSCTIDGCLVATGRIYSDGTLTVRKIAGREILPALVSGGNFLAVHNTATINGLVYCATGDLYFGDETHLPSTISITGGVMCDQLNLKNVELQVTYADYSATPGFSY